MKKSIFEMRIKAIALTLITSLVISCAAVMPVRAEGDENGSSTTPGQQTEQTGGQTDGQQFYRKEQVQLRHQQ